MIETEGREEGLRERWGILRLIMRAKEISRTEEADFNGILLEIFYLLKFSFLKPYKARKAFLYYLYPCHSLF